LIEIIVVVAIIGVMVAFVGVSVSRDSDRLARLEAKRFLAILNEVRDESILAGEAYFLLVDEKNGSYHFAGVNTERSTNFDDGLLRKRNVEPNVTLEWQVFEQFEDDNSSDPKVLITPLGELTPFEASFEGEESVFTVYLDERNQLAQRSRNGDF
jgi:type II secretory pathway pseudopilin PulG